ncbi:response regulator [Lentzea sp. NPDC058436]|uniref:response regulator n=1 Tax=Lentzea sp. NPDC058436 TaxID=3346499 RepID=UPI00364D5C15
MGATLVVEDDAAIRTAMTQTLHGLGHTVHPAASAAEALRAAAAIDLDLILLDLGLPDLDGVQALRMLRGITTTPVLVSTARTDEDSIVSALEAGADGYITKPFSASHLTARIGALLRRSSGAAGGPAVAVLRVGELTIDLDVRSAALGERPLTLTRREFDLLTFLARKAGQAIPRDEICEGVWGKRFDGDTRSLEVHVSWLRRKLGETAARPRFVHTVRGIGFKLAVPR